MASLCRVVTARGRASAAATAGQLSRFGHLRPSRPGQVRCDRQHHQSRQRTRQPLRAGDAVPAPQSTPGNRLPAAMTAGQSFIVALPPRDGPGTSDNRPAFLHPFSSGRVSSLELSAYGRTDRLRHGHDVVVSVAINIFVIGIDTDESRFAGGDDPHLLHAVADRLQLHRENVGA